MGLPLVALGLLPDPTVAVSLIAAVGVGNAFLDIASVTLLQRAVEGAAPARVLGLVETVVVAGLAIGGIGASVAVAGLGVRAALLAT